MAHPLRIAFLWHQHQPSYHLDHEFLLPWVRLHAAKDYVDLPLLFQQYPSVKHTINVVPSLLRQLAAYATGDTDMAQRALIMDIAAAPQTVQQEMATLLTTMQLTTMGKGLTGYATLHHRVQNSEWPSFSTQEWRDLAVGYHLSWIGPISRQREHVQRLLQQEHSYSVADARALHDEILDIAGSFVRVMSDVQRQGTIEISVTPAEHPILPLLIDRVSSADADRHVQRAIIASESAFGQRARGMWPAEGSVSMDAVDTLARFGVVWTATDSVILRNTLSQSWFETAAFFPWRVSTRHGEVAILFRDHELSDAIGFQYMHRSPADAVHDLMLRLEERRQRIVHEHGEASLEHAVVPIILDGENCWEFYEGNGHPFLHELLSTITRREDLVAVTCSEATQPAHTSMMPALQELQPGSWIDGTFGIWSGSPLKDAAWDLVRDVRQAFEGRRHDMTEQESTLFMDVMLQAEASDWFWWYDDRHIAPHKLEFDRIFRADLRVLYDMLQLQPRYPLDVSLYRSILGTDDQAAADVRNSTGTMHQAGG
jgi:alpha-amylase/alpha-mannosidase (GH57 family)